MRSVLFVSWCAVVCVAPPPVVVESASFVDAEAEAEASPPSQPPRKSKEEVDAEMDEMHTFWCHPGAGRASSSLCQDIMKRQDARAAGEDDKPRLEKRTDAERTAVNQMHAEFCAIADNRETKHPCLMWEAKETRARRRMLMRRGMKPEFMDEL